MLVEWFQFELGLSLFTSNFFPTAFRNDLKVFFFFWNEERKKKTYVQRTVQARVENNPTPDQQWPCCCPRPHADLCLGPSLIPTLQSSHLSFLSTLPPYHSSSARFPLSGHREPSKVLGDAVLFFAGAGDPTWPRALILRA